MNAKDSKGFRRIKEIYISEINQALSPDKFEIYFKSSFKQLLEKLMKKGITKGTLVQGMMKLLEISECHSEKLYNKFMNDVHNENSCEALTVDRAKELINLMIGYYTTDFVSGEQVLNTSEIINQLFVIGFTEEELINEFGFTEDDVDRANAELGE